MPRFPWAIFAGALPQPPLHWDGTRKADHFGTSCVQSQTGSRLPWTEEFMKQGPVGEDCLFLNVWTAAKTSREKRPVMFWIYGGGFSEGSSSVAVYNGAELDHHSHDTLFLISEDEPARARKSACP
jgi:carboxylesterase type B